MDNASENEETNLCLMGKIDRGRKGKEKYQYEEVKLF